MPGPNPYVALPPLNRIRASIIIPLKPQLNVSQEFLTKAAIRMSFEGETTEMLPVQVSQVQSQQVYQKATILIGIAKTSALAALYKAELESDSNLGDITVVPDTSQIPNYQFINCAIENQEGLDLSGSSAEYPIRISGTYYINSNLFNQA